ncbi:hypothetical protein ASD15_27970 [Massilia sp. Root351]|jgi:hypothetical protein|uniref:SH3 domain-containing protein n=1 Tax=Massilia sp. Root351 TaxID=1736522 RepID=UPI00070AF28F|nr:SH3 domain-containing protein [Massilia sp. Root351]KQV87888.1 hypothetical protein ASD15_27970 [Massilia sp. Root351]
MHLVSYYGAAAWLAGLAITLVLASWLTPRAWWRRPTVRNLCIAGLGAWACGSLILHVARAPLPQLAQSGLPTAFAPASAAAAAETPTAGRAGGAGSTAGPSRAAGSRSTALHPFRVHRDLNLRAAASVDAPRLALVPAGASVVPTGVRSGDWWEVRAVADGAASTGWVSSLWLRRTAE